MVLSEPSSSSFVYFEVCLTFSCNGTNAGAVCRMADLNLSNVCLLLCTRLAQAGDPCTCCMTSAQNVTTRLSTKAAGSVVTSGGRALSCFLHAASWVETSPINLGRLHARTRASERGTQYSSVSTHESLMIFVRSSLMLLTRLSVPKRPCEMDVDQGAVVLKKSASAARASDVETPESRLSSSGWRVQKYPCLSW